MNKSIKVAWFPKEASRENVLSSNGKSLDKYCIKCVTDEKLSGDYPVDLTFINTDNIHKLLYEGAVLKLKLDYGFEVFNISKVTSDLKYIDIVARQHTIQSTLDLYLEDVRPTELTGQSYLQYLLNNSQGTKDIFVSSDITDSATGYYQDMSLYKALHDCEQSFYNKLGGEIQRRGYNLTINRHIGNENTGITIRERKNLLGLEIESDIDNLVTIARGKGYNGITGHWIESKYKNNYKHIHKKTIEFSDVKVKSDSDNEGFNTETEAIEELDRRIQREFNENHIDTLKTTYRLSYIDLGKTSLYKEYSSTERAYIGDTIRVYVPRLDTDIKVRVIERKYDVLKQKVIESILSNYYVPQKAMSIDSIISDLKKEYSSTYSSGISAYIAAIIKAGMQDSYVTVRDNEILIMDTKDINTARNVWRWNKGGLSHSNDGYYTTNWNVGITQDGKINAKMILTGILTAITIKNIDGSFMIDLSKSGGCKFLSNNVLAMEILKNGLNFYGSDSNKFGVIGTYKTWDGTERIGLIHESGKQLCICFDTDAGPYPYVRFDADRTDGKKPVHFYTDTQFSNAFIEDGRVLRDLFFGNNEGNISLGSNTEGSGIVCTGAFGVDGDLNVTGDKNCIQQTSEGNIRFSAIEDYNALLTYTSIDDVYKTTQDGDIYSCKIDINKIGIAINECLNTEMPYVVEIYPEDDNTDNFAMYKVKREKDYFIVKSNVPMSFKFTLKARRKGFESRNISNEKKKIYLDILLEDTEDYYNALWEKCGQEWSEYGICIDD